MKDLVLFACILFAAASADDLPGWVNACIVVSEESEALASLEEMRSFGIEDCGYLWIPDWPSLSGFRGWLVYSGPYSSREEAAGMACRLLWKYPDIYSINVSLQEQRLTEYPDPRSLADLMGLMPPTGDHTREAVIPEGWYTEWTTHGTGDEWVCPVQITSTPPGWSIDSWQDVYAGTVEIRALRHMQDNEALYLQVEDFIRGNAEDIEAAFICQPGEYALLHRLPNAEDRCGDWDFWIVRNDDHLEFGARVRSFYGEMPYSWINIPDSARISSLPVMADDWSEAIDLLEEKLRSENVYREGTLENVSFGLEYCDGFPEGAWRDYYDIAVREVHREGGPGDPATAPILDRFRVYSRVGEILWFHPLYGVHVPFSEIHLRGN